eukprot:c7_g1_i2.p1 GENE.c7_g1_i2~~c7_g1_i2.p1  ORF type:complete len:413 (+),score=83.30 c7_g1_i2:80-1318(+)
MGSVCSNHKFWGVWTFSVRDGFLLFLCCMIFFTVFAWGRGQLGELGCGQFIEKTNVPQQVPQQSLHSEIPTSIACGHFHTVIQTENRIFACGAGLGGQLGSGRVENEALPVEIPQLRNKSVTSISASRTATCVIDGKGILYTWGKITCGQLGHGDCSDQLEPRALTNITRRPFRKVASGELHSVGLSDDKRVYVWGSSWNNRTFGMGSKNDNRICVPCTVPELRSRQIVNVACGHFHTVLVDINGSVITGGFNYYGQLGVGNTQPSSGLGVIPTFERERVVMAAAGAHHTLLLTDAGEVFSCGCNMNGELGLGADFTSAYSTLPQLVSALMGTRVISIACGAYHSAALTEAGALYCWGSNAYGQLGQPNFLGCDEPQCVTRLPSGSRVLSVSCGSYHTAIIAELTTTATITE